MKIFIAVLVAACVVAFGWYMLRGPQQADNPDSSNGVTDTSNNQQTTPDTSAEDGAREVSMQFAIIKEGTGIGAEKGDVVTVHYTGWLENDTKFDSSVDRGTPFKFILGAREVIPGWDAGVEGMKVGEVRKLVIPPELAYGERGIPGAIPPNSTLIFTVEMLAIN
ncbi:MAG: peptidylprolyl isomerase [Candidatus Niyogibacteria bacterium CG10_big_fil_rev_8_21_14_0_10_46_36]|uniref:Peptidyl-prolyl cis-trans isomerase n=1 Tax=Candidatus Niyogibacteria bacterium CG10_big_fil_rev_8_21_14_0_10_46_36 TaxID=1974726 RepID=A0A2H0TDV8_9BACT|nr:MAG: peptidylprolyl isomerase [Candidatus Niyogibacteria bacterium CG10_big_fil_rev_8_21_14_0_10_46_36]